MPKKQAYTFTTAFSIIIYFIVFSIIGLYFIPKLDLNLSPKDDKNQMQVSYNWPGASPETIEIKVSSVLESMFSRIRGIKEIRSESRQSSGLIYITTDKHTDTDIVRFEISAAIKNSMDKLPQGVSYPVINNYSESKSALIYSFTSDRTEKYIYDFITNSILPEIRNMSGINKTEITGWNPYLTQILYDYDLVKQAGLQARDIDNIILDYYATESAGQISIKQSNSISLQLPAVSKSHHRKPADLPLVFTNGRIIRLSDIASIKTVQSKPSSYFRLNGKPTMSLVIYPKGDINLIKFTNDVRTKIKAVKTPNGISRFITYDASDFLKKELRLIFIRTMVSLAFLLLFIFFLYRNVRLLMVVIISLLINLLTASLFYKIAGIELNIYALAGISVSLGMMIDNIVLMTDHIRQNRNIKIFPAILAASLTTIAVLSFTMLYGQNILSDLSQFGIVILINLALSLIVALFFVPAVMKKIHTPHNSKKKPAQLKRLIKTKAIYNKYIKLSHKRKFVFFLLLILIFGLPVYKLPKQISGDNFVSQTYNSTLGSNWYRIKLKKKVDKYLGGTLRLFEKNVFENSFLTEPERTSLTINAKMPEEIPLSELNRVISEIEKAIAQFSETDFFKTRISQNNEAQINIFFKPEVENGNFPPFFKNLIIQRALQFDNVEWQVTGIGNAFSNSLNPPVRSAVLFLHGYNYEQLNTYAQKIKEDLQNNPDVSNIWIGGNIYKIFREGDKYQFVSKTDEYSILLHQLEIDPKKKLSDLNYTSANPISIYTGNELQKIIITPRKEDKQNRFTLEHLPVTHNADNLFLPAYFNISKQKIPKEIFKRNQKYEIIIGFNHVLMGAPLTGYVKSLAEKLNKQMPPGYKVVYEFDNTFSTKDSGKILFILLAILSVYIICSIVFESLIQPLAVILMIPISFIGVFLTFSIFNLNFDQGGYAAFLLLAGISVNSAIYIINDYNNFKKGCKKAIIDLYIKAFNHKINVIYVTVFSTILGLIPFLVSEKAEVFWQAFAAGTIGGLVFSLLGIILCLPLFLNIGKQYHRMK